MMVGVGEEGSGQGFLSDVHYGETFRILCAFASMRIFSFVSPQFFSLSFYPPKKENHRSNHLVHVKTNESHAHSRPQPTLLWSCAGERERVPDHFSHGKKASSLSAKGQRLHPEEVALTSPQSKPKVKKKSHFFFLLSIEQKLFWLTFFPSR